MLKYFSEKAWLFRLEYAYPKDPTLNSLIKI
jgi:hypothetical protein